MWPFRTDEDKHREACYPHLLANYQEASAEAQRYFLKIQEQEASVKANRAMYQIAEKVVREQAEEIERLKSENAALKKQVEALWVGRRYWDGEDS